MRKHSLVWMVMLLIMALALPAAAQNTGSVVDVLADDPEGRFIDLVSALEIAGLAETLETGGPYTVFAPTDEAFAEAIASMGTTRDELLGDPDTLTNLLNNHVVVGVYSAEQLPGAAAQTLGGASLTAANDGGALVVNGTATVIAPDLPAVNGIVHVIDAVLIPPPSEEDIARTARTLARVRFAHLSPDTPAINFTSSGQPTAAQDLSYGELSDWYAVPAEVYTVSALPVGGVAGQALVPPTEVPLPLASWHTVALVGSRDAGTLQLIPVLEDYSPIQTGNSRVTVFHAISELPAIDMTADGDVVVSELAFPFSRGNNDGAFVIEQLAGTYDLQIIMSGTANRPAQAPVDATAEAASATPGPWLVVDLPDTTLEANTNYFLAVAGTGSRPDVVLVPVSMEGIEGMTTPLLSADSGVSSGTLRDVLAADDSLSTMLASVQAAGLEETLSGDGSFTLFAPTDAAFEAAAESLGLTGADLLADSERLAQIIQFHILEGEVAAHELGGGGGATALNGQAIPVIVSTDGTVILDERAVIVLPDLHARNGVLHVIDAVLLPE